MQNDGKQNLGFSVSRSIQDLFKEILFIKNYKSLFVIIMNYYPLRLKSLYLICFRISCNLMIKNYRTCCELVFIAVY
jgi:hypothetical protein